MQFTKLRLVGFKSFVEPMEFVIEQGLNGVVGPNGCGKSNLVEALRWVMGENSYKNMRASGMEDVIFSGSATRPARNWAEVTLYLDNHDHSVPAQFAEFATSDELQVSRRIERDKGSTYRINDREVRARDVQLLFADQSTGARSPSMVGQGRIGELIAAKPQARRALLEEASGISGLHSRRHEAELRLRAAEANLERLDDVTGELASRIEALKRQVRQANRFKILSHEIRKNEAGLFYLRWIQAKSLEATLTSELNQTTLAVAEQAQIQAELVRAQEQAREALPALREEAIKAAAALTHLNLGLKALEEEQKRKLARRSELMRILEQLARDEKREQELMLENEAMLERLEQEEEELREATQDFAFEQEELRTTLEAWDAKRQQGETALQILTDRKAEVMAQFEQNRRQLELLNTRKHQLTQESLKTQSLCQALDIEMKEFDGLEILRASYQEAYEKLHDWEEKMSVLDEAIFQANEDNQTAQTHVNQLALELRGLQAEERTIEKMLVSDDTKGRAIWDEIEVEKGFEQALGGALGDDLSVGLDENAPIFWQNLSSSAAAAEDPTLPDELTPLLTHVKAPAALHRCLAQIGLIATDKPQEEIVALQQNLKTGQALVNSQGAVWRWDGLTIRADAPTHAAQRLAQKNRLQDIKAEITRLSGSLEKSQAKATRAAEKLSECERLARTRREDIKNQRLLCEKQRKTLEEKQKQQSVALQRHSQLQEAMDRLKIELATLAQQQQEHQEALMKAPDVTVLTHEIEVASSQLREIRLEWQHVKAREQTLNQTQAQNLRRLETIIVERKNWTGRIENARRQLKDLASRREESEAALEDSAAEGDDFGSRRQALLDQIAEGEMAQKKHADALAQAEEAQATLEAQAARALENLSARREARARCEERLGSAIDKGQDIERQITETLQQKPADLLQLAELSLNDKLPEMTDLEQALERGRIERERLGAVNLRAEEEAGEMNARYQTMTAERDDVIEAMKKLRQAIHALNHEGRERLLAAFGIVNEQFQRLFTHLFGGGTAELQLIESDDPLEAGLEILARPPGKKPQTMTLLSGGEQALTATALIFAVFLTNPAPICVLDEVDAPLDDHNVERYCNLLDEMARSTQTRFVVITHNPITMARMSRLFGVTMAEQGVSQLVSVDLRQAEQIREIVSI